MKWTKRKKWKIGIHSKSRNFHIPRKLEIANFNSLQKVQDFQFLNGTAHHVIVDGAVWSNPLLQTSWRRLPDVLRDVFKTSWEMSSRRLQDVFKTYLQDVLKTSWKTKNCYSAEGVFKTSSRPTNVCWEIAIQNRYFCFCWNSRNAYEFC